MWRNKEYKKRLNASNLYRNWWQSIDRVSMGSVLLIIATSLVLVTTASPPVAVRIGLDPLYFMKRQLVFLAIGVFILIGFSFLSIKQVRRFAVLGLAINIALLAMVLIFGSDIKGAKRWLNVGFFALQPSEFVKPLFAIFSAWVLAIKFREPRFPAVIINSSVYLLIVGLLLLQPDFGMTMTVSVIWFCQIFVAGLGLSWVFIFILLGFGGVASAYIFLPHVKKRIDGFLNPLDAVNYQVKKSVEAYKSGGFYGVGPGEGMVKYNLPDSHTDFIFAVLGEEMGVIACVLVILLYAIIVIRGLYLISDNTNLFEILAVTGILTQIGLQSFFNIGVTLHLLPTKGMTLPLVSYGGSSVIATAMALGLMLALTRKRYNLITLPIKNLRGKI